MGSLPCHYQFHRQEVGLILRGSQAYNKISMGIKNPDPEGSVMFYLSSIVISVAVHQGSCVTILWSLGSRKKKHSPALCLSLCKVCIYIASEKQKEKSECL